MTTMTRGRIPRLICASCISSALLISAGATTAIAATQSPMPVQQIPRDDSGGGSDTGDQSGNGSDTGNQPSDNGGGTTDNGSGHNNTGGGPDNGGGTTDNGSGHNDTGGGPDNGGGTTDNGSGSVNNPGGASDLYRVCVNAGRQWIFTTPTSGYCGWSTDTTPNGGHGDTGKQKHSQKTGEGLLVKAGIVNQGDIDSLSKQIGGCAGSISLGKLKDLSPHIYALVKAGTFGPKAKAAAESGNQDEILRVTIVGLVKGAECLLGDSVPKAS